MKKAVTGLLLVMLWASPLFSQTFKDGFYFAQDSDFAANQKNQVALEVKGGKIVSVNWNIESLNAGAKDLKSIAQSGGTPAAAAWASQAAATEAFLVSSQNVNAASVPNGPANVKPFFDLVKKALASNPVARGAYKDGWYYAEAGIVDSYHTKNSVIVTVVNGTIVDVLWNGILQGMPKRINPSKQITSRTNGYPMPDAKNLWHIQANIVAAMLVSAQNPDMVKTKADGTPDGISGASIQIKGFLDTAKAALQSAK
jgi:major membrane immunogen (membrane-anchored lipoprotein)